MKKSIFLFFAAILCSVSAWAYDLAAGQYVYFEKPADWSNVSLLLGHNSWSQGYNMTKISNTNLYYWKTDSWGGYTRYCFIDAKGWGGEGKKPDDRKTYASHSTNVFTNQLIKYHLFTTAGSKSSHASSYATAVNRTQTIKVQLKDGSNWVDATLVPADLKASTYALTSATAAGAKSASLAKESTTVSATVDAAYSATVSLTCENVLDGYVFDGWYDANGNKITSYTVSDAHTVSARFIQSAEETNEVTVTYMCGTTSVATAIAEIVGVETEKSFTAPTVTGYKFTEWTIGTGITLKAGTASDATISVVTKSASSDYTLIANYEEVIETIYFINTGKWSVVNLHRWGGTAAETAWPGEAMTSTGEKIGEYDVYSFTAQQGAFKNVIFTNKNTGSDQTGDLEWTAGKYYINNYNGNSGWYTKAEAEELLVVPAVYETVYFVNNKNWTKVQIHAWKGSVNNGWPGQALTATGEKVEGFDVYSFEAAQGTYTNLIFNNKVGDAGDQSSNFVWTADKYYYMGAAENYAGGTKEEVAALVAPDPLATDVFLAGEMNSWNATANEFKKATAEATTASVTISLTAKTYMFKIIAGDWLGNKGTMKRDNCTGWTFEKLDGGDETNCKIVADIAGDYTFTWDLTSKKLTVTYPELPTYNVTATVNPAETGSVEGAKEYKQGEQATLTANAAEGYEFVNWTVGGKEVSTEATYSFNVTADVALVANFKLIPPTKYNVTVTANAEGENVVTGGGEYEEGEEVTVTASEDLEGWVFIGWTEDGEFVANDPEYTFDVKGDVELVAVYAMDLGKKEVTDLVIDGDNKLLTGSVADFPMGTMNLELALGEYDDEEGVYLLTEESKLYVGETNFTFVDGMAAVDMDANSAMAIVVFQHSNGAYYYMTVNMSKKIEATVIEIDNATVTIEERSMGFGDEVYHVLKMESTWSDGETTYPVSLETTEFDQTKESQEVAASITVGGMGDEDPWLGSAEGDVTITVANGVVTVEGLLENASAWPAPIAFDLTISGKLPVEKIAYELNGGAFPEVKVPTNAELWEAFKPYYNEYYDLARADQPIDKVSTFAPAKMQEIMTDEASEYKWLGDYVLSVATAAGVTLSTDMASANESGWRWAVHAFFNAAAGQYGAAGIDFTEAGKPEVWGAAYLAEYGVVLPTEPVEEDYTLPTPVKEGYTFVGWYDNAEGTGEAYTVIPAGWSGTLYAIWKQSPATALDNIAIEGKVVKTIINGQLIIIKNGVQYNAQGQVIK